MFSRRAVLAGTAAVIAMPALRTQAVAADFEIKWGHSMAATHPLTVRGREAAEKIRSESGGRVDIQVFPDSQLGADNDMVSQVRTGALQIYTPGASSIAPLVPLAGILTTAFAFKDVSVGYSAADGDLGTLLQPRFEAVGLHMFEKVWGLGFRQVTTATKPVNTPDDLAGVKIRVPTSPMLLSIFEALGASPVSMNVTELYSALQTKIVDGQENALSIISTRRFDEVQKYCALTNHCWDAHIIVMNNDSWKGMPDDMKEIVARNLNDVGMLERGDISNSEVGFKKDLESKGLIFNTPNIDAFREKLKQAGYYAKWQGVYGDEAWEALTKYAGAVN